MLRKMKSFGKIDHIYPVNVVSNNKVDKDLQSMLFPLNLMQYIMFCPKYRIKDNIITPNSLISNVISLIVTIIFICAFIHCTYNMVAIAEQNIGSDRDFMSYFSFYNCAFFCFGCTLNFLIGIFHTKTNIQFVLTYQEVHRFLNDKTSIVKFVVWNWIIVVGIVGFYAIIVTCFHTLMGTPFKSVYAAYIMMAFDFNMVYVIRVIQFLENKIVLWNIRNVNFQETEDMNEENNCTRMFQAYVQILECYDIYKESFQPFVSIISEIV